MHTLDWLIATVPLLIFGVIALRTRRYVRGVADFMAGGRNAGRYLICAARSEQGSGAVVFVGLFQQFYVGGFALSWWQQLSFPIALLVAITGFVVYRYRQTCALTLAQFFEMRYSRKYRLFAGMLGFFAGIVNFGVIPVLGARFMVFFLELPQTVHVFSHLVPTYLLLMGVFLTVCVTMTTSGGQISVLLTDCVGGMLSQILYIFVGVALLIVFFRWWQTKAMLLNTPPGKSLVNPFDSFGISDFNIWFVLMGIFADVYRSMAWQNGNAFDSSAVSAHESRMGRILGKWRDFGVYVMVTLLALCAMTYIKSPHGSVAVQATLARVSDPSTHDQMRVPVALSQFLPIGVKGALVSICLMGIISGDGIHLHSWGSIFVQDVIMPMRKKPFTTRQHLWLLRLSIVAVALWAFIFGALFPQMKYVGLWWAATEAIFVSGAGVAIIGGLYWSRGSTAGAWAGLTVGSGLAMSGIGADLYCRLRLGHAFILNGRQMGFFASILAIIIYAVVSWLTCKTPHNMDQLLHRGKYVDGKEGSPDASSAAKKSVSLLYRIVGIDDEFTRTDRWIALGIFWWSITWFAVFLIGTAGYFALCRGPNSTYNGIWADYWLVTAIYLPLLIGLGTTIWFTIGCWQNIRTFFRRLRVERIDPFDDGTVSHDDVQELARPVETTKMQGELPSAAVAEATSGWETIVE